MRAGLLQQGHRGMRSFFGRSGLYSQFLKPPRLFCSYRKTNYAIATSRSKAEVRTSRNRPKAQLQGLSFNMEVAASLTSAQCMVAWLGPGTEQGPRVRES